MCCLQEVRWRGQDTSVLGMGGRIFMLWSSENEDCVDCVGVMVKDELSKMLVGEW